MVLALGTTAVPAGSRLKGRLITARAVQLDRPGRLGPAAQQGMDGLEHTR